MKNDTRRPSGERCTVEEDYVAEAHARRGIGADRSVEFHPPGAQQTFYLTTRAKTGCG